MKTIEQKIKKQIRAEVEKLKETYLTYDKNYRFSFKKDGDVYLSKGTTYDHPLLSNKVVWGTEVQTKNVEQLVDVFFDNLINYNVDKWSEISKTELWSDVNKTENTPSDGQEEAYLWAEYEHMMKEAFMAENGLYELRMAEMSGF
jgi:hypothetical protein